jgi:hypothetical protein
MVEPFDTDTRSSFGAGGDRARDDLNARFRDLRRDAAGARSAGADGERASGAGRAGSGPSGAGAGSFRDQASQAADEAKSAAATVADQVRARLNEVVAQQKAAGADKIAGVAKAAHSAAGELDHTSPQVARLVRSAAGSVDRIAEDVRSRDLGEVFGTLADFGRRQPVAFFGGAVVAGFLLARFFKSDAPLIDDASFEAARRS